jgi:hypothetical protein
VSSGPDDDRLIQEAARTLLARYGEDAAVIAVMRAAEAAALGDLDGCTHWEAVAEACETPSGLKH